MKYQPNLPEEIEAYGHGLEKARQVISLFIGKLMMVRDDRSIKVLNDLDDYLMDIINE